MTKSKQQQKLTIAESFKLWLGGLGRSKMTARTGLSKGELHQAFMKLSGKTWSQLKESRKGAKGRKAKVA